MSTHTHAHPTPRHEMHTLTHTPALTYRITHTHTYREYRLWAPNPALQTSERGQGWGDLCPLPCPCPVLPLPPLYLFPSLTLPRTQDASVCSRGSEELEKRRRFCTIPIPPH